MISFTKIEIDFKIRNRLKLRKWIKSIIFSEGKVAGNIAYVFCSDLYLGGLNEKYLKHHSLTDIITFDYSEKTMLSGDICISIERIRDNSFDFNTTFDEELGRVMAHGLLHLAGYKDKSVEDKKVMRYKEDFYLASYPNL
jgi:probable rRNA maturation factor